jgi:hypothetical protein
MEDEPLNPDLSFACDLSSEHGKSQVWHCRVKTVKGVNKKGKLAVEFEMFGKPKMSYESINVNHPDDSPLLRSEQDRAVEAVEDAFNRYGSDISERKDIAGDMSWLGPDKEYDYSFV